MKKRYKEMPTTYQILEAINFSGFRLVHNLKKSSKYDFPYYLVSKDYLLDRNERIVK